MLRYLRLPTRKIFSPQHFEFQIICCRFSVILCLYKIKCFRAYQMPGLHSKEGRHCSFCRVMHEEAIAVCSARLKWLGRSCCPASQRQQGKKSKSKSRERKNTTSFIPEISIGSLKMRSSCYRLVLAGCSSSSFSPAI